MKTFAFMMTFAALALAGSLAAANEAAMGGAGSPDCCARCGRRATCQQKTCQVVCEIKKEKKTCWCVECVDMCPLMPGHRDCDCCQACGEKCGAGDCCSKCGAKCPVPPRCGHPRTVKKLVKKEYEREVPVYKCVVKYLCGDCGEGQPAPATAPGKAQGAPTVAPSPPLPPPPPKPAPSHSALNGLLPLRP